MKSLNAAKKMILTIVICVISMASYAVSNSELEKEATKTVQKILNNFYGLVSPAKLTSFHIHTRQGKKYLGTATFSWQGKTLRREVVTRITKENFLNYQYECEIFNYENDRFLEEDALMLFAWHTADIKEWKGIKVNSYKVLPDKKICYNVSLEEENGVIIIQISKQNDGTWFQTKIVSAE